MGVSYLRIMKTILSLLFALTLGTAFGQFIPQPMGYNPDVNGDEFIGVDDVMGTLALYNSPFDNGDSLVIKQINFPQDAGTYADTDVDVVVDESWDIVYLHNQETTTLLKASLPSGSGYKVVQFFVKHDYQPYELSFRVYNEDFTDLSTPGWVNSSRPVVFTFIRGHDGEWYIPQKIW